MSFQASIQKTIEFYRTINKSQLIDNLYEKLYVEDPHTNFTSINFPIHYLFDHTVSKVITATSETNLYYRNMLELNDLFSLDRDRITDISTSGHATILYKFEYLGRKYIYYSNSGLGIDNQSQQNKSTSCNILYFHNKETLWTNLNNKLKELIHKVQIITKEDTQIQHGHKQSRVEEIWNEIKDTISGIIDKTQYDIIIHFMISDKGNKGQCLCYALLNHICHKFNKIDDSNSYVELCTINHVLSGNDNVIYTNEIKKIYHHNFSFKDLIDNTYNYNRSIYNKIEQIPDEKEQNCANIINEFKQFIDDINDELYRLPDKTIQYKLKNSFHLFYNNISGLYNNIQQSESCTFYSYYNLALNMKILNVFNKPERSVQEVIDTFVTYHYRIIYLFCIANDTQYLKNTSKFNIENLYDLQHIYRLIIDNELYDEIITFYDEPTFLLYPGKLTIDQLLNFKIAGKLKKKIINYSYSDHIDLFKNWYNYLDTIIFNIRNKNLHFEDISKMYNEIKEIFKNILEITITPEYNRTIYRGINKVSYRMDTRFNDIYFNTIAEIWIIYLIFLFEIYNEDVYTDSEIVDINNRINSLEFVLPIQIISRSEWHKYDPQTYTVKYNEKKIKRDPIHSLSQDIMSTYLNFNEIINISKKIESHDFLTNIKIKYKIEFNFCWFITAYDRDIHMSKLYEYNNINLKIYSKIDIYGGDTPGISHDLNQLLFIINKITHYIYNTNISQDLREQYKLNINHLKNKIKRIFLENISVINKKILINNESKFTVSLLILILTDNKLMLIPEDSTDNITDPLYTLKYLLIRNFEGIIIKSNLDYDINKILSYLCETNDNEDDKITNILAILGGLDKNKWIQKLNFSIHGDMIKYENIYYNSLTYDFTLDNNDNNITKLLNRFGLNFKDLNEYIFLYPDSSQTKLGKTSCDQFMSREGMLYYNIKPNNEKCFILIHKYKKCIEIKFTDNPDQSIDINNCYIFDETNKDKKNKLLFNLSIKTHPFISMIPANSPYLCYEKDNHFYLEFILSPLHSKNKYGDTAPVYINDKKDYDFEFAMYTIKIAPSFIFPTINTYNSYYHNLLLDFYQKPHITLSSRNDTIKEKFSISENVYKTSSIVAELYNRICKSIDCRSETDMTHFENVLSDIEDKPARKKIIDSFYNEHRIAPTVNCEKPCIEGISQYIYNLNEVKKSLILLITLEKKIDDFIVNNIRIWLALMEVNVLINLINQFIINKQNGQLKSGDIQDKLTALQSIQYFNDKSKTDFYYGIEILFLLQNEYFFKESQMIKYNEIRQELLEDNKSLKCHQFMMGKGKTSVFTPLLSFVIKLVKDKQPTIITMEHLIKPTRKYTIFIEDIMNIKVIILSDFQAKKRWLEHTDLNLSISIQLEAIELTSKLNMENDKEKQNIMKQRIDEIRNTNLEKEMNLIDEFDSHHNYLQSMFNFIDKKNTISIDLFTYIFIYTFNKTKGKSFVPYNKNTETTELIQNEELLYENLEIFYTQSETMTYNKDYGFAFTIEKDYYHQPRICTPFARKDTPVKNSNFSSLLLTLILTFKEYITNYGCKLDHAILYDYNNFLSNKQLLIAIIDISQLAPAQKLAYYALLFEDNVTIDVIQTILSHIYSLEITEEIKNQILIKYLYTVNYKVITITSQQYNMSFQDIIYNNHNQWQVGYTGTAYLQLNKYEKDETNVFRNIIKDPDEIIEIKLALDGYAYRGYSKNVIEIDRNRLDQNAQIMHILTVLDENPRGFVDLAGIFLDLENKNVAQMIKLQLAHKNIVYFEDDHEAYQYNDSAKIKYTESHPDNFYYYDQCHTVGSDLKQPFDGKVGIIINRNTRYTDFAQAVFRFRKINRGTCVSVFFVKDHITSPENNDQIYDLLLENETKFNNEQQNGLKYQLLKAMIRKESKDYIETNLKPEFTLENRLNKETIIQIICENIKSKTTIQETLKSNLFIQNLYNSLVELNLPNLIELVLGSGNEIQQQQQQKQEQQKETKKEQQRHQQRINYVDLTHRFTHINMRSLCYIQHLNCELCVKLNCVKLFNSDDIKINNKNIFISYNILTKDQCYPPIQEFEKYKKYQKITHNRFYYIEFNDKILIETESVALDYYLNKLPVYNFEGTLLLPHMYNSANDRNLNKLDIDIRFIEMLGISNYINPIDNGKSITFSMSSVIADLNPSAFIILSFHIAYNPYKNRYNLSPDLQNRIINFRIIQNKSVDLSPMPKASSAMRSLGSAHSTTTHDDVHDKVSKDSEHNTELKDNLTQIYFNIYNSTLDFRNFIPERIRYRYIFYFFSNNCEQRRIELVKFNQFKLSDGSTELLHDGGALNKQILSIPKNNLTNELLYKKYLKYKKKYLHYKKKYLEITYNL
jgi:hypothetical protein